MLDPLDQRIQQMGLPFVRYADDFLILCETQIQALQALSEVSAFITGTLKLIVNQDKTRVAKLEDCSFPGSQIPQGLLAHEFQ